MNSDNIPSIGQIVHYHPDDHARYAAIVVEVGPPPPIDPDVRDYGRPALSLQILAPEGKITFKENVKPFDLDEYADRLQQANVDVDGAASISLGLKGRWTFQDEIAILQTPDTDEDEQVGSTSNRHVGEVY
jgi:hypothetical protein